MQARRQTERRIGRRQEGRQTHRHKDRETDRSADEPNQGSTEIMSGKVRLINSFPTGQQDSQIDV